MLSSIDELKGTAVQFLSDKFDSVTKKVQELEEKLLITGQENKHLKTEVSRLSIRIARSEEEIRRLGRRTLRATAQVA